MAKARKTKEIPFSKARQQLSTIIDEVQKPARSVTIVRHGKPAAVLISHDEFQFLQERSQSRKKWKLAGSLKLRKDIDIDKVLEDAKQDRIQLVEKKTKGFVQKLNEP